MCKIDGCLDLNSAYIGKNINVGEYDFEVFVYEKVSSTNQIAKELGRQEESNVKIIVANSQEAGKGRIGRIWSSEPDNDIYLSMVFTPKMDMNGVGMVPILAALAVKKALSSCILDCGEVGIKWPNDIIYNNKKVSGVLCESRLNGSVLDYIVVGIGVNVNRKRFDEELMNASSLHAEMGVFFQRDKIIVDIVKNFFELFEEYRLQNYELLKIKDEYNKYLVHYKKEIKIVGITDKIARSLGINNNGELEVILQGEDDITIIRTGEVSIRGKDGYI